MLARARLGAAVALAALSANGCSGALDPHTPQASRIATLWWVMFAIATVVGAIVLALLALALRGEGGKAPSERSVERLILAGAGITAGIIIPVFGFSLFVSRQGERSSAGAMVVEVTAHQWWYEVRYPSLGVTARDELHLPSGADVTLRLTSADVIHSLWIPQLNGKMDMFPGRTTTLQLRDVDQGEFPEACAEFCGVGHADMRMPVVVEDRAAFDAWVAKHDANAGRAP